MNSTPHAPEQSHAEGPLVVAVRTAGKILLGAALLLLIMGLTILRNDPVGSQGSVSVASQSSLAPAIGSAVTADTGPELTAYQQAVAGGSTPTGDVSAPMRVDFATKCFSVGARGES